MFFFFNLNWFSQIALDVWLVLKEKIRRSGNSEPEFQKGNGRLELTQNQRFQSKGGRRSQSAPENVDGLGMGKGADSRQRDYFVCGHT